LVILAAMIAALTAAEIAATTQAVADAAYPYGFTVNIVLANGAPRHRPAAAFFHAQGRVH
jgi:hypothetical protein